MSDLLVHQEGRVCQQDQHRCQQRRRGRATRSSSFRCFEDRVKRTCHLSITILISDSIMKCWTRTAHVILEGRPQVHENNTWSSGRVTCATQHRHLSISCYFLHLRTSSRRQKGLQSIEHSKNSNNSRLEMLFFVFLTLEDKKWDSGLHQKLLCLRKPSSKDKGKGEDKERIAFYSSFSAIIVVSGRNCFSYLIVTLVPDMRDLIWGLKWQLFPHERSNKAFPLFQWDLLIEVITWNCATSFVERCVTGTSAW